MKRDKKHTRSPWSSADIEIVSQNYGVIGPIATQKLLPKRTVLAVQLLACRLKIKAPRGLAGWHKGRPTLAETRFDHRALCDAFKIPASIIVMGARQVNKLNMRQED